MAAEQQGTVIGVQGEHTLHGAPVLCLAVQLWPEKQGDVPNVIFVTKRLCNEYLCLVTRWRNLSRSAGWTRSAVECALSCNRTRTSASKSWGDRAFLGRVVF